MHCSSSLGFAGRCCVRVEYSLRPCSVMQEGLALLPTPGSSCNLQKVRKSEQTCGQKAGPTTLMGRLEA